MKFIFMSLPVLVPLPPSALHNCWFFSRSLVERKKKWFKKPLKSSKKNITARSFATTGHKHTRKDDDKAIKIELRDGWKSIFFAPCETSWSWCLEDPRRAMMSGSEINLQVLLEKKSSSSVRGCDDGNAKQWQSCRDQKCLRRCNHSWVESQLFFTPT